MVNGILERYSCHPSIVNIKSNLPGRNNIFHFSKVEPSEILKIIKGIKPGTSAGVDNIPLRLVVMSEEIIAEPLSNLINATMLDKQNFPDVEKEAAVTPAFKKEDMQTKTNYRPISVLNAFLRFLRDSH